MRSSCSRLSGPSARADNGRIDLGPKAPGIGIQIGKKRSSANPEVTLCGSCPQFGAWHAKEVEPWVTTIKSVAGELAQAVGGIVGDSGCFGSRIKQGRPEQARDSKTSTNVCTWNRADIAGFFGVPDDEDTVRSMALAQVSQIAYTTSCKVSQVALPFMNQMTGGDVISYGVLRSLQSVSHLGGSIGFGRFADVYGTNAAMLAAHSAAFAFNSTLALATSQSSLFLSVLPCAAMQGFQAAQFVAATRSTPETRGQAMSRTTLSYGIGCAASTVLLVVCGKRLRPRTAATIALGINAIFIILVRRSGALRSNGIRPEPEEEPDKEGTFSWSLRFKRLTETPGVARLLFVKAGVVAASGLVLSMVPQFAVYPFGLTPAQSAMLLGYRTAAEMLAQAYIGQGLDRLQQVQARDPHCENGFPVSLQVIACGGLAVVYSLVSMSFPHLMQSTVPSGSALEPALNAQPSMHSLVAFAVWVGPLAAAQQVVLNTTAVELSKLAPQQDVGFTLGLDWAIFSASGIVTPLMSSVLMQHFGFVAVPLAGAALVSATVGATLCQAAYPASDAARLQGTSARPDGSGHVGSHWPP